MNNQRYNELSHTRGQLTMAEIDEGCHYCPEWDFKLLKPESPEMESCLCNLEAYKAKHGTANVNLNNSLKNYMKKD